MNQRLDDPPTMASSVQSLTDYSVAMDGSVIDINQVRNSQAV